LIIFQSVENHRKKN